MNRTVSFTTKTTSAVGLALLINFGSSVAQDRSPRLNFFTPIHERLLFDAIDREIERVLRYGGFAVDCKQTLLERLQPLVHAEATRRANGVQYSLDRIWILPPVLQSSIEAEIHDPVIMDAYSGDYRARLSIYRSINRESILAFLDSELVLSPDQVASVTKQLSTIEADRLGDIGLETWLIPSVGWHGHRDAVARQESSSM